MDTDGKSTVVPLKFRTSTVVTVDCLIRNIRSSLVKFCSGLPLPPCLHLNSHALETGFAGLQLLFQHISNFPIPYHPCMVYIYIC